MIKNNPAAHETDSRPDVPDETTVPACTLRHVILRGRRFFIALLAAVMLLPGCQTHTDTPGLNDAEAKNSYAVAPVFREFYDSLGGEKMLGPAISPAFDRDSSQCQYTLNVLMCQNPSMSGGDRFYLDSLGNRLNIRDIPGSFPENANQPVVDGFIIFPDFFPIYTSLYGSRFAGKALTQVRYNYDRQRVEQYFENVAVAHDFDDPAQVAYLMPLGHYFCDEQCSPAMLTPPGSAIIENLNEKNLSLTPSQDVATPFAAAIQQMGGYEIFGRPISHPFFRADGYLMHVFENVVVCSPADSPEEANLCPLSAAIGIQTSPAGHKLYDIQDNMMFYIVQGELGFHVPLAFDAFIQQHGGRRASGNPIGEVTLHPDGTIRQCFDNYCLDYDAQAGEDHQVSLAALGQQYLQTGMQQGWIPQNVALPDTPVEKILLLAGEEKPQLNPGDTQTIYISVLQGDSKMPLAGRFCRMTVSLPDAREFGMDFPLTDSQGNSAQVIPAMPELQNGSMVAYRVCLADCAADTPEVCTSDAYLVWSNN